MLPSAELLILLMQWEGFKTEAYKDVAGLLTIGVGHLLTTRERQTGNLVVNGKRVNWVSGLTKEQVEELLLQDLLPASSTVNTLVKVPLTQNQFDALVSFVFNVGSTAFARSTLLKVLNNGEYEKIPAELGKWIKAGGKTVQGLVNRRNNEIKLWKGIK